MNLKRLKELVDLWAKKGVIYVCDNCGEDMEINPEDEVVTCKKCDSEYWVEDLIKNMIGMT